MSGTHVLIDDRGTAPLRWRYRVQDARTRQTWLGACRTRDEALACVDAYLRGLWRARDEGPRFVPNGPHGKKLIGVPLFVSELLVPPEPQPPSP